MWNESRLAELASKSFRNKELIIVSNRAPYVHEYQGGRVKCIAPAGGLTAALTPIVAAARGTWVAQASGSADRANTCRCGRLTVPPEDPKFTLRRLWIPDELQVPYYEGLANQALWPLCHNVYQRPIFRDADWAAYKQVNQLFANAVIEEARGRDAVVFIQDYHLAMLPRMLKAKNPRLTVAQFWHIPWPGAESMRIFPWIDELLQGMLGNDLIGFHLPDHCSNFLDTVKAELSSTSSVDRAASVIASRGRTTTVRCAPISIDFARHVHMAASNAVDTSMRAWNTRLRAAGVAATSLPRIVIGIDRMDYTKGIPERLRAVRMLFEHNPGLRGKVTYVQVAVPSRSGIPEYSELERTIDAEVAFINQSWGTPEWQPVILEKRNLGSVEMMALHRLAAVCLVTSLHDGMNLVAKEFVASRIHGDGVLILSRFAGAALELQTALQVNPFSESCIYTALLQALSMPERERRRRMSEARRVVETNNVYRWAATFLEELEPMKHEDLTTVTRDFAIAPEHHELAVAI